MNRNILSNKVFVYLLIISILFPTNIFAMNEHCEFTNLRDVYSLRNNRYYYKVEIVKETEPFRVDYKLKDVENPWYFNDKTSSALSIAGLFSSVVTAVGTIYMSANSAYQHWANIFMLKHPGYIYFRSWVKVKYRVDRLNGNMYIEDSYLYIEANKYLYNSTDGDVEFDGTEVWSTRIK